MFALPMFTFNSHRHPALLISFRPMAVSIIVLLTPLKSVSQLLVLLLNYRLIYPTTYSISLLEWASQTWYVPNQILNFSPPRPALPTMFLMQSMAVPFFWLLRLKTSRTFLLLLCFTSDLQSPSKSLNCSFKIYPESPLSPPFHFCHTGLATFISCLNISISSCLPWFCPCSFQSSLHVATRVFVNKRYVRMMSVLCL